MVDSDTKIYTKNPVKARLGMELRVSEPVEKKAAEDSLGPDVTGRGLTLSEIEARAARIMRDLYAPAGVLINSDMQVLHFHGQTGFFLEQASGEASLNLLRLARESLVYPLRRAVDTAFAYMTRWPTSLAFRCSTQERRDKFG